MVEHGALLKNFGSAYVSSSGCVIIYNTLTKFSDLLLTYYHAFLLGEEMASIFNLVEEIRFVMKSLAMMDSVADILGSIPIGNTAKDPIA